MPFILAVEVADPFVMDGREEEDKDILNLLALPLLFKGP
jgi:hypothetical protein